MLPRASALGCALLVAFAGALSLGAPAQAEPEGAILYADSPTAVPGRYIVVLNDAGVSEAAQVSAKARDLAGRFGGQTRHVYTAGRPRRRRRYSPQRLGAAITVGNSNSSDARNSSSNYGTCLDIFAPGTSIVSASYSSNNGSATMTGTSMASPHVAGSAALYLGANPNATPAEVRNALVNNGTTGKITSPGSGSPNRVALHRIHRRRHSRQPVGHQPGNRSTAVGQAVDLQMQASGGTTPYTWSACGLPAGLSISSSTGRITGSPTTAGTSNVTVTVTDSGSRTGTANFTWTVTTGQPGCNPVQVVGNSGFESGSTPWTASQYVIGTWSQYPARGRNTQRLARRQGQCAHRHAVAVGLHPVRMHQRHPALLVADRHGRV